MTCPGPVFFNFFEVFVGPRSFWWGHWYPLFRTSDDSAHEFQSQGGSVVTYALLSLVCNNPQSHLWLPGLGIKPGWLAPEASTIPLHQPNPVGPKILIDPMLKSLAKDNYMCYESLAVTIEKVTVTPRSLASHSSMTIYTYIEISSKCLALG